MEHLDAVAAWLQRTEPSVAQEVTCYAVWLLAIACAVYYEYHPVSSTLARLLLWASYLVLLPLIGLFTFMLGYPVLKHDHEFRKLFGSGVKC